MHLLPRYSGQQSCHFARSRYNEVDRSDRRKKALGKFSHGGIPPHDDGTHFRERRPPGRHLGRYGAGCAHRSGPAGRTLQPGDGRRSARRPTNCRPKPRSSCSPPDSVGSWRSGGSNTAYESPSRLLTVIVELDAEARVRFHDPGNIEQNVRRKGFGSSVLMAWSCTSCTTSSR